MKKNDIFNSLDNCCDDAIERLSEVNRLTDEEIKRITAESERKMQQICTDATGDNVSGVENFRPRRKFPTFAAVAVCITAISAGGLFMLKNPPAPGEDIEEEQIQTEASLDIAAKLGVEMEICSVSSAGAVMSIRRQPADFDGEISTSQYYRVEKFSDEEWKEVPQIIDNAAVFASEAITIYSDTYSEEAINWEWLYGELEPGDYRLVRSIVYNYIGESAEESIYSDFTIPEEKTILADMPVPDDIVDKEIKVYEPLYDYAFDLSDINEIFSHSENVVVGTVESLTGANRDGTAYTDVSITVTEDFSGRFNAGDTVNIRFIGGYISMREKSESVSGKYGNDYSAKNDGYWYEKVFSGQLPVIGQEYAFVIGESGNDVLWNVSQEYGVFLKTENGFTRRVDERKEYYSFNELKAWFSAKGSPYFDSVTYDGEYYYYCGHKYAYKYTLCGRLPNAACDSSVTVLTNSAYINYSEVMYSILSSNSNDFLESDVSAIIML